MERTGFINMGKKENKTTELKVVSCSQQPEMVVGSFFNGLQIPASTDFDIYKHKLHDKYVLHGENTTLEYNGQTEPEQNKDYVVAFYDKKSKAVQLFRAPVVPTVVTSKEQRVNKRPKVKLRGLRNAEQKIALGREFGTKKVKAKISNYDRNRIDSNKLEGMEIDIIDNVTNITSAISNKEQMESASTSSSVAPPVNATATSVEDLYAIEKIIPKDEWNTIRVHTIMEEPDLEKRLELLPYGKSAYVAKKLHSLVSGGRTTKVQILYYASLLFGVYNCRRVSSKAALLERLENRATDKLIDGVLERFTALKASGVGKTKDRSFVIDPFHEDKLLCYLLALLFHIDDFMIEINPLANELNMKPTRLTNLLRALGASTKPASASMAEALGLSKRDAMTYKVAVLKVPFTPPELIKRRGR